MKVYYNVIPNYRVMFTNSASIKANSVQLFYSVSEKWRTRTHRASVRHTRDTKLFSLSHLYLFLPVKETKLQWLATYFPNTTLRILCAIKCTSYRWPPRTPSHLSRAASGVWEFTAESLLTSSSAGCGEKFMGCHVMNIYPTRSHSNVINKSLKNYTSNFIDFYLISL